MAQMSRPKKDPSLVKGEILKIPLTESQKSAIVSAATRAGVDTAAWARDQLVSAAAADETAELAVKSRKKAHGEKPRR